MKNLRSQALIRRGLSFLLSLWIASVVVFALVNLLPGDMAAVILGSNATEESINQLRELLGLNMPWPYRYLRWVADMCMGRFGVSAYTGEILGPIIASKWMITASLVSVAMVMAILIATPLGMASAMRRHRLDGVVISLGTQLGMTVPAFLVGIALSVIVGVKWRWLPANEYVPFTQSIVEWGRHIILPALTLALVQSAILVRYIRSAFIDILHQDYYRTARAVGWRRWPALIRHGLRNASVHIITIIGLQLATLFVGAIVIESVFVLQGLGQYLLQVVAIRDLPVVQSIVMILVALVLAINCAVDMVTLLLDPRLRVSNEQED